MRYSVKGFEVRSENAAKPVCTVSRWLLDWIRNLQRDWRVLDLGCGKLRHTIPLSRQVRSVIAVDSKEQVDRSQTIDGKTGVSVRDYASRYLPNARVFALSEAGWHRWRYDRVLLAYVLSAIPFRTDRLAVLGTARDHLRRRGGEALIATTFANSRFRDWEREGRGIRYRDGFIMPNASGASFYGLISLDKLKRYCRDVGLEVVESGRIYGETGYVVARRRRD